MAALTFSGEPVSETAIAMKRTEMFEEAREKASGKHEFGAFVVDPRHRV